MSDVQVGRQEMTAMFAQTLAHRDTEAEATAKRIVEQMIEAAVMSGTLRALKA